jgi:hypothetical protein
LLDREGSWQLIFDGGLLNFSDFVVSIQDTEWKVFPRFVVLMRSTLLFDTEGLRSCVEVKTTKDGSGAESERHRSSSRSTRLGKRLDPDLKSWLDNVIIPALVREYLAEIEKRNRLATTGTSEVTSN